MRDSANIYMLQPLGSNLYKKVFKQKYALFFFEELHL